MTPSVVASSLRRDTVARSGFEHVTMITKGQAVPQEKEKA
jgi:hypothetical protein